MRSQHNLLACITVGPTVRLHYDPISQFLEILRGNPSLSTHIKELTLKGQWEAKLQVSARWLAAILQRVPNLRLLRLHSVDLTGLDRAFTPPQRFKLQDLEFLRTGVDSENMTLENTLEVLGLFEHISRVSVFQASAHTPGRGDLEELLGWPRYASKIPKHLSITALQVVDRSRGAAIWLSLIRRLSFGSFTMLRIMSELSASEYGTLRSLLQQAGAGLRVLQVNLGDIEASSAGTLLRRSLSTKLLAHKYTYR